MTPERLQKIIAGAGLCSRREAEEWIAEGRVLVNGKPAVLGQKADPSADAIRVDGKVLRPPGPAAARRYILLTDDGDFSQAVSHPSRGVAKTYRVKVWGEPSEKSIERLRRGVVLDRRKTAPAEIDRHHSTARKGEEGNTWYTVVLHEGKSRQIRRMFELIGHPVSKLNRVAIGALRDEKLPAGAYRKLTEIEIRRLLKK